MEGKVEAACVTFIVVIASIAFYHLVVKSYLPTNVQGWVGL